MLNGAVEAAALALVDLLVQSSATLYPTDDDFIELGEFPEICIYTCWRLIDLCISMLAIARSLSL